jgi:D-lyxose ketol-isomerase
MKRSEINAAIAHAKDLLKQNNIALPFFGYTTPEEIRTFDLTRIKAVMLGWDVTDFGSDDFKTVGATLFTVRNGEVKNPGIGTPYAEKYIIMAGEQEIPMHYHMMKTEDIINRAGGDLMIQVYNSKPDRSLDTETPVELWLDGVKRSFAPGEVIRVTTGNSVTLTPYVYHRFFAEDGDVVVGEVSSINDDNADNVFLNPSERFTGIDEDEAPLHLLCNEY